MLTAAISTRSPGHWPLRTYQWGDFQRDLTGEERPTLKLGDIFLCGRVPDWIKIEKGSCVPADTVALGPCCPGQCPQTMSRNRLLLQVAFVRYFATRMQKSNDEVRNTFSWGICLASFFQLDCLIVFLFIYCISGCGGGGVHLCDVRVFKCKNSIEWKRQTRKNTDHYMILLIAKSRTVETDQAVIEIKIVTSSVMGNIWIMRNFLESGNSLHFDLRLATCLCIYKNI